MNKFNVDDKVKLISEIVNPSTRYKKGTIGADASYGIIVTINSKYLCYVIDCYNENDRYIGTFNVYDDEIELSYEYDIDKIEEDLTKLEKKYE